MSEEQRGLANPFMVGALRLFKGELELHLMALLERLDLLIGRVLRRLALKNELLTTIPKSMALDTECAQEEIHGSKKTKSRLDSLKGNWT